MGEKNVKNQQKSRLFMPQKNTANNSIGQSQSMAINNNLSQSMVHSFHS